MWIKKGSLISFFSSGFPSHVRGKAVDLSSPDGKTFFSPFKGKLIKAEKFFIGRPNRYATSPYDYILSFSIKGKVVKVLHVEPTIDIDDEVVEGQEIGYFVNSPYTGGDFLHAHIEGVTFRFSKITDYRESRKGKVVNVSQNYFDVEVEDYASAGKLNGVGCCGGLLNTSYPYACYGGIIGGFNGKLSFFGINLGRAVYVRRKNLVLFEGKKGLIRTWERQASFKILANEPVCGKAFFESVLSYGGKPRIRFFRKYFGDLGDKVDIGEIIRYYMGR
ncbi:hypothetical protein [Stygiolobus caldivivus]|uniref:DUF8155 domain-containing protein n=1 Tax=Stygiolobus caldivivus TaxID=2824673 RepID=A0A8D5U4I7_9CREN|nr:hypothetical protein [Stygiolobus caldivivus]BCU69123.1 hypothetical protein KN1_04200 [Stygiolobus caldivivus]